MTKPVLNIAEVASFPNKPGSTNFGSIMAPMGEAIGAKGLGAMYMQIEPSKRVFPFHNHHGNGEMFVVGEGRGFQNPLIRVINRKANSLSYFDGEDI